MLGAYSLRINKNYSDSVLHKPKATWFIDIFQGVGITNITENILVPSTLYPLPFPQLKAFNYLSCPTIHNTVSSYLKCLTVNSEQNDTGGTSVPA